MNYLTIEKFSPADRVSVIKKMMVVLILLVVPFIIAMVWLWLNLERVELGRTVAEKKPAGISRNEKPSGAESYSFEFKINKPNVD